ncbi:hypothetical protein Tco_0736277 [Tanacetum coccineum]
MMIRRVTEEEEDVREVFQQRGSGAKRKLSRCGRDQMGNEPILALPEGSNNFVVYYDLRSKDLEACLEKGRRLFVRCCEVFVGLFWEAKHQDLPNHSHKTPIVADSSQAAVIESTQAGGTKRTAEEELGQQSSKKQKPDELSQEELLLT